MPRFRPAPSGIRADRLPQRTRRRGLTKSLLAAAFLTLAAAAPVAAQAPAPPDPAAPGPYATDVIEYDAGQLLITIPSSTGAGGTGQGQSVYPTGQSFPQPLEGTITYPTNSPTPGKVVLIQHGRHSNCFSATYTDGSLFPVGDATSCEGRRIPNWAGYQYLAQLLASNGYVVISASANSIHTYDNNNGAYDAGAVARAQTIANSLDLIDEWGREPGPGDVGSKLIGKVDSSVVGMMGHSRGGEGVTQFITYNRQRPGKRYNLQAVYSLAPIDRNKQTPIGTNYATLLPACDGDVSTISGANAFERGKYAVLDDPFVKVQQYVEGANHNWYNTRWLNSDRTGNDTACGVPPEWTTSSSNSPTSIRLSDVEQRRTGVATMISFLRAYVGGESGFVPWLTGEAGYPANLCPETTGRAVACGDLVKNSFIAAAGDRQDIVRPTAADRPTTAEPTARDSAGGTYSGTGFSLFEWCNPDPFVSSSTAGPPASQSAAAPIKACAGPTVGSTPVQSFMRSYGPQIGLAWDGPATLAATLRGPARDASKFGTVSFRAAFQFTDVARNGIGNGTNPRSAVQDLYVALIDSAGAESQVKLTEVTGGIQTTLGSITATGQPRHLTLQGHRIPLTRFTGVDLADLDRVELRFGTAGVPATGAIQLADLAFQEPAAGPAAATRAVPAPTTPLPGDPVLPKVDAVVVPIVEAATAPVTAVAGAACTDLKAPIAKLRSASGKGRIAVRGTSSDATACASGKASGVERVQVTITKLGGKTCRYVTSRGTLTTKTCATPLSIIARGKKTWQVTLPKGTPKGSYRVLAQAVDKAGNLSKGVSRKLKVT